jgi:hypothetical protein
MWELKYQNGQTVQLQKGIKSGRAPAPWFVKVDGQIAFKGSESEAKFLFETWGDGS